MSTLKPPLRGYQDRGHAATAHLKPVFEFVLFPRPSVFNLLVKTWTHEDSFSSSFLMASSPVTTTPLWFPGLAAAFLPLLAEPPSCPRHYDLLLHRRASTSRGLL